MLRTSSGDINFRHLQPIFVILGIQVFREEPIWQITNKFPPE